MQELQREILRLKNERGIAVLLTDHNVRETLAVTDRSYILAEGRILAAGAPKELIQDQRVRDEYLGTTFRGDEFDVQQAAGPATRPRRGVRKRAKRARHG